MSVVVGMKSQANLLEIVATLHSSRSFPRRLNRRKKQTNQNPNNGDNNEQLDECETEAILPSVIR